ncbi:hypothetical protein [Citrobacter amalonaticus]|uniref:hypothetical protein n=1 Tax=Citrobacter amalonaticus TaxID=35703 RepID=UPI000B1C0873|nr:hypothetical protein [Citrobacter amalonaticus]
MDRDSNFIHFLLQVAGLCWRYLAIYTEGYVVHNDSPQQDTSGLRQLSELASTEQFQPFIVSDYALEDAERGYERLISRRATGSLLLKLNSTGE